MSPKIYTNEPQRPIRVAAEFAPFVEFLQTLGFPIGSLDASKVVGTAEVGQAYVALRFRDIVEFQEFADGFTERVGKVAELDPLKDRLGPGIAITANDGAVFLYWPHLFGDVETMH